MTTFTELEQRTTAAWATYRSATAGLEGAEYETVEQLAWASLSAELEGIDAERAELLASAGSR